MDVVVTGSPGLKSSVALEGVVYLSGLCLNFEP